MRGFGVTSASFATEVQMDKIARTVGMNPFEIRLLNAYRNGDMRPYQKVVGDATLIEVVKGAADMIGHELSEPYASMNSWDRDYSPARPEPVRPEPALAGAAFGGGE
jgi:CO/xanthine dehydrogenase Mo-binding subunit